MSSMNLRLYDIFRKKFNLSEADALEVAREMEETLREHSELKYDLIHKDIQSLKDYMDSKFSAKEETRILELKIEQTKSELTKSIYWVGFIQFVALVGAVIGIVGFMLRN